MEVIKVKLRAFLNDERGQEDAIEEVCKVSGAVIKKAACNMKPIKGDVSESFTSDAILNAPDILFDLLAKVFQSWLVHGTME